MFLEKFMKIESINMTKMGFIFGLDSAHFHTHLKMKNGL